MALLARIFTPQRKAARNSPCPWGSSHHNKTWPTAPLDPEQIRLVLYRDHELKRSILFDSSCLETQRPEEHAPGNRGGFNRNRNIGGPSPENGGPTAPPKYSFCRHRSDTKMLGEMMFGSGAMVFRGSTLKVHTMRTPPQLMVTKVFQAAVPHKDSGDAESLDSFSLPSSSNEYTAPKQISGSEQNTTSIAHSIPVDVPNSPHKLGENEDSGISASVASSCSSLGASFPSPGSSGSMTSGSNSLHSLQRRWLRSQHTSLEHNLRKRFSEEGSWEPLPAHKRSPKIGIGIIFSLKEDEDRDLARRFQNFFFSHITLLESHVNKLGVNIEKAYLNRKAFIPLVIEALSVFRQSICDLYTAPRLSEPVWINMMCHSTHKVALCQRFLKEFMLVVDKYDTKNTKFFLSTLLTAVLTHHLAWVPTVTPAGATPSRTYLDKHSAKWLDAVAKSHPYNPLWAQLGDLYGAIGFPLRLSRTLVVGKKADVVSKLLYILSYFLRCSEIHENLEFRLDEDSPNSPTPNMCHPGEMTPITESVLSRENSKKQQGHRHSGGPESCETVVGDVPSLGSLDCVLAQLSQQTNNSPCSDSRHLTNHVGESGNLPPACTCDAHGQAGSRDFGLSAYLSKCTTCGKYVDLHTISDSTQTLGGSGPQSVIETNCNLCHCGSENQACDRRTMDRQDVDTLQGLCSSGPDLETGTPVQLCNIKHCSSDNCERTLVLDDCSQDVGNKADNLEVEGEAASTGEASICVSTTAQDTLRIPGDAEHQMSTTDCNSSLQSSQRGLTCHASPDVVELAAQGEVSIVNSGDKPVIRTKYGGRFPMFFTSPEGTSPSKSYGASSTSAVTSQATNEEECQVSPTEVLEDPRRLRIRSLGRSSVEGPSIEVDLSGIDSKSCSLPLRAGERRTSLDACCDVLAGDSGCFDGTSSEVSSQSSPNTSRKDSLPSQRKDSVTSTSVDTASHLNNMEKPTPVRKVFFERSNSMFNEYFENDEIDPDLLLPVDRNLTVKPASLIYKRHPSVEGSSSMFDEYMDEPVPELAHIKASTVLTSSPALSDPTFTQYLDDGIGGDGDIPSNCPCEKQNCCYNHGGKGDGDDHSQPNQRPTTLPLSARKLSTPLTLNLSRQSSIPGRCRPVTPTELGRRRHASSLSTASSVDADFFLNLKEVVMPGSEVSESQSLDYSFGRSLMGGFSSRYLSDFALHGTSDVNYLSRLHNDLTITVQNSVLDEPIAEAAAVVADTDKWSVRLMRCQYASATQLQCEEVEPSPLIGNIIESVRDLWKLKMSPEFCLMHLEDRLQEVYFKSRMLAEYIFAHKSKCQPAQLAAMLGFDKADLPLLLAVAGTHTPLLSMGLR